VANNQLVIAPAAKMDLREIYNYGLGRWGQKRSSDYLTEIKELFWSLTENPMMGIERFDLLGPVDLSSTKNNRHGGQV